MKVRKHKAEKPHEMDYRAPKRFELRFFLVSVLCLSGAFAAGQALWRDINESGQGGIGTPVATLVRKEARVKRRPKNSYAWKNVSVGDSLFHKDSVQTSLESAAALKLANGSTLELGPSSLVVLDDVGDLSMNFLRGQAVLRTATGDSRLSVENGRTRVEQLAIRIVKPEPLAELLVGSQKLTSVAFNWEPRAKDTTKVQLPKRYTVQISHDENFRGATTRGISTGDGKATSLSASLEPGRYYWRVLGLFDGAAAEKPLTETAQFRISAIEALRPVWPNPSQKITSFGADSDVQFRWMVPASAEDLDSTTTLEISADPQFRTDVVKNEVDGATGLAAIKNPPAGIAYWRLRTRVDNLEVLSRVERYELARVTTVGLELNSPDNAATLPLRKSVNFSWVADSAGIEYTWELERSSGESIATITTKSTSADWKKPVPGAYRWRVSAAVGTKTLAQSPWRLLSVYGGGPILLEKPANNAAIQYWDKPETFSFEWKEDELVSKDKKLSYEVEVARDAEFKTGIFKKKLSETRLSSVGIKFDDGRSPAAQVPANFFWRVNVVEASGQLIKKSTSSQFTYGVYPPLRAPASAQPEPGAVFNVLEQEADPTLSWAQVTGAQSYEVVIHQTDAKGKTREVYRNTTPKTALILKGLKEGSYGWTVYPIDRIQRRGEPLDKRSFTVTYGQPLPAPQIISPEVQ